MQRTKTLRYVDYRTELSLAHFVCVNEIPVCKCKEASYLLVMLRAECPLIELIYTRLTQCQMHIAETEEPKSRSYEMASKSRRSLKPSGALHGSTLILRIVESQYLDSKPSLTLTQRYLFLLKCAGKGNDDH